MKEIIKIAWRNLWRNKRRTYITAASIFFAVFFAIFMRSFQLGTYGYMIEQSIESYTGYLQLQNPEYFDDPIIDNSFQYNDELIAEILKNENVKSVSPRIESFAMASTGTQSKGVLISGIDPEAERDISNPYHRLVRYKFSEQAIEAIKNDRSIPAEISSLIENYKHNTYSSDAKLELELGLNGDDARSYMPAIKKHAAFESSYLSADDDGVLISDRLSKYLKATVGDTVVLISQGYHGISAAGVYPVRGIIKMASPELDNKLIYMTIQETEKFLGLDHQVTSMVISLNDNDDMLETQLELQALIPKGENYAVKNWEEIMPTLRQQIEGDNAGGQVFLMILYVIVFFGIFGTVLMMIAERKREFGVMIAIGMKRKKLTQIVSFELMFIGLLGTLSGMLAITPFLLYGHYNPFTLSGDMAKMYEDMGFDAIMPLALFDSYFFMQGIIVIIMILIACTVPLRSINRLKVIDALHGK